MEEWVKDIVARIEQYDREGADAFSMTVTPDEAFILVSLLRDAYGYYCIVKNKTQLVVLLDRKLELVKQPPE